MVLVLGESSELKLDSCCENQIKNQITRRNPTAGHKLAVSDFKAQHPKAIHRTGACLKYNCHGLTFASRRTAISDPEVVASVLKEDSYEDVSNNDVLPGDIAIYTHEGDIHHSGIVLEKADFGLTRILGKWGFLQEVIHWSNDVPPEYWMKGTEIKYYRIKS